MVDAARATIVPSGAARSDVTVYVVPGRIEVLGKHTDYAGGRSLLAAVERSIVLAVAPRTDATVRVTRLETGETVTTALEPDVAVPPPGHWSLFPATVSRRLARDFAGLKGADIALTSDLPIAAGLSSSSALITALAMALIHRNALTEHADYRRAVATPLDLCGYLGAVENGYAFGPLAGGGGIGTAGGSEDHTAILSCRPGELSAFSFMPVRAEGTVPLPASHVFAVAVSGVVADKTGNALERYNRASRTARTLLERWRTGTGRDDATLGAVLDVPGSFELFDQLLARSHDDDALRRRWHQFHAECTEIIPGVRAALKRNDVPGIGPFVDKSQAMAEHALENQIAETISLQRSARSLGATAASAFGAGFGGSVWALVQASHAENFLAAWREGYARTFSEAAKRAEFFLTGAGPGLIAL